VEENARRSIINHHPNPSLPPLLPYALLNPFPTSINLLHPKARPLPRLLHRLALLWLRLSVLEEERGDCWSEVDEGAAKANDGLGEGGEEGGGGCEAERGAVLYV
jgi:hypothetical protein